MPRKASDALEFVPGGLVFAGVYQPLRGKPLAVLKRLAAARWGCTWHDLADSVWGQDAPIEPNTVACAVVKARGALRAAVAAAGSPCPADPIPCVDHGRQLAWRLHDFFSGCHSNAIRTPSVRVRRGA